MPEDYLVLDLFCGTGAFGEAALRTGRAYLGADVDPVVATYANERLQKVSEDLRKGEFPTENIVDDLCTLYIRDRFVHQSAEVWNFASLAFFSLLICKYISSVKFV